jgi:predicted nucleic acid-binding Zn ribbon protein
MMHNPPSKLISTRCYCCYRVFKASSRQDYCSNACRQASYRNRHGQLGLVKLCGRKMICQICGLTFNAIKKSAKYCSPTCRKMASRIRNKVV